jgi:hypothetical protein
MLFAMPRQTKRVKQIKKIADGNKNKGTIAANEEDRDDHSTSLSSKRPRIDEPTCENLTPADQALVGRLQEELKRQHEVEIAEHAKKYEKLHQECWMRRQHDAFAFGEELEAELQQVKIEGG